MASQRPVQTSVGCAWVQNTEPPLADRGVGMSWLNTANVPYLLETWDGANWVVQDYVTDSGQGYTTGYVMSSYQRSTLDKFIYSSETYAQLLQIFRLRVFTNGVGNNLSGYTLGGHDTGTGFSGSKIDKLTFLTEAVSTLSTTLSRIATCGFTVFSGTSGYQAGGQININASGGCISTCDKFMFISESVSGLVSTLTIAVGEMFGAVNSNSAGYGAGGALPSSAALSTINRILFSSDSISTTTSNLTFAKEESSGLWGSLSGFFLGGVQDVPTSVSYATADKLVFSSESVSSISSTLSVVLAQGASLPATNKGYISGGVNNAYSTNLSTIHKLDIQSETISLLSENTITAYFGGSGISH
jgi:hypothetical protein